MIMTGSPVEVGFVNDSVCLTGSPVEVGIVNNLICLTGSPVEVGITMFVSSVSSISEVNMVRTTFVCIDLNI